MGFRQALDPATLGRYASAGTFTAAQIIQSSGNPLTLNTDAGNLLARVQNIGASAAAQAGCLTLGGSNGLGTGGAAWQLGVDVGAPTPNRDAYIAKINADNSARDVLYFHNGGAGAAALEVMPIGFDAVPAASLAVGGRTNSTADSPLLLLRPPSDLTGDVLQVLNVVNSGGTHTPETGARLAVTKDGALKFGAGAAAPGGLLGALGITADFDATAGFRVLRGGGSAGVSQTMQIHNTRTPKANLDGVRLSFGVDGTETAQIDSTWKSAPSGTLAINVKTGASTFAERFRADSNGVSFFGGATVGQSAAAAAVVTTAATQTTPWGYATQAQADAIVTLVNNLRAELRALGLLT